MRDLMKDLLVFARHVEDQYAFLCDRCGNVHFHGAVEGGRTAHCRGPEKPFGDLHSQYKVLKSAHKPGSLADHEAERAQLLMRVAFELVSNTKRYLEIAKVPKSATAVRELTRASNALYVLTGSNGESADPFQEIVTDEEYSDEEE